MEEIIPITNQGADLLADSRNVAELFSVEHTSFRELIEDHEPELTELGVYRFETDKPEKGTKGGRPSKFYWLNFDQIAFLLTLSRATAKNKEFRLKLILAFRAAREKLRPVDSILLTIPDKWQRAFPHEFYKELLNLYGDTFDESKNKPSWVGGWTNKFIYEPLIGGLSGELKRKRATFSARIGKDSDYYKMHQFLEENAREDMKSHITKITTILTIANSKQDFIESFAALFYGHHQMKMLLNGLSEDWGNK